ncbi:Rieske 2Fe-2S domain-containing protein [Modestobacter sp. I12A-02628]|uniref:Cytochrome bc1 complex Rieske iron-sulfur subunit n=2 Tax=Goekera deserti TaxID=2497753 RepID=A0A7K3WCJ7_9ACTN|nr:Rieske 2Fe-2S domain-containing protein [Goekera deserti]NDI47742.1 Rieske 2Fe-2S domain-containing protein [Goekera deserti]NEL53490.1 Rieske (2Fe-2S) protein [Goekera deserti]
MTREELDRLGARLDGVEILHTEPAPPPGSKVEKAAVRQVTITFLLAGLLSLLFLVVYAGSGWFLPDWAWVSSDDGWSAYFTPLLGATMGGALLLVGIGLVLYVKKLLPHETAVQDKHDGSNFDRVTTGATLMGGLEASGLPRRKLLGGVLGLMGAGVGVMIIAPLGGLIKNPNTGNPLGTTSWNTGVRLVRDDGTPIRPGDQTPGSLETVFPAVPGGDFQSDAATMLIRLRPEQMAENVPKQGQEDFGYGDYVAYSKICTHAGCPVSLYEQETSRILCPCHQSQFDVTQGAKPIFGPAARSLPQLPIGLDDEGYFVARSDYIEPVGPTYWNRERI